MERGSRNRFQHYKRSGCDPFDTGGHDEVYPGAVRSEAGLSKQPQSDENDEGRRGYGNGTVLVRRQNSLRAHGREQQLGSVAGVLSGREAGPRLHNQREDLHGEQYRERRFRHLLESAVSDPHLRHVRCQHGSSGPLRRRLHDPRNSRENDGYPRWSDALHSSRGRAIPWCPARSNRRGQIQDRSWGGLRIRRRERSADDQTTQWGKGFHEGKITLTNL